MGNELQMINRDFDKVNLFHYIMARTYKYRMGITFI